MNHTSPPRCVALFDLDGTLTRRDTLLPFLTGYLRRHPARLARLGQILPALARYATDRDRGALKAAAMRSVMGGEERHEIDTWAGRFVAEMTPRGLFRPAALAALAAHRAAGDALVLLSASPDLYVPRIGRLLGFERTLCTEVLWHGERLDGALKTCNRHGEEKTRCLAWVRSQYPGLAVVAYGNSASDLPHLRVADRALLVNGDAAARRSARRMGVAVGDWP